jgi:hypothetical protein
MTPRLGEPIGLQRLHVFAPLAVFADNNQGWTDVTLGQGLDVGRMIA